MFMPRSHIIHFIFEKGIKYEQSLKIHFIQQFQKGKFSLGFCWGQLSMA
ncbi:hypothetical protein THERMOT_2054 [Bathymodiolus thermophilus thioautotrophic gill symbiont]|nr:hypothetical protein THERMOT_2054 [Bathymodiolus thermophilus thioautotrophic gill symbiont]